MSYAGWNGIPNQISVVQRETMKVVEVCQTRQEAVKYIDAMEIPERYEYCTMSDYELKKKLKEKEKREKFSS